MNCWPCTYSDFLFSWFLIHCNLLWSHIQHVLLYRYWIDCVIFFRICNTMLFIHLKWLYGDNIKQKGKELIYCDSSGTFIISIFYLKATPLMLLGWRLNRANSWYLTSFRSKLYNNVIYRQVSYAFECNLCEWA